MTGRQAWLEPEEDLTGLKDIIKKVKATISRYHMIRQGERIIVGVSGGPDSVCLLHILNTLREDIGMELIVAHFDHGLRPNDDQDESRFVEALAESLGLAWETKRAYHLEPAMSSLEERARDSRYAFFREVRDLHDAHKIAIGHNLDDQAETILLRLLRGSGATGLAGIPPCRDGIIIRPLIDLPRDDILRFLEEKRCHYHMDSSNLEKRYLRNRIRLELLPIMQRYQPRILSILSHTADTLREDDRFLSRQAQDWLRSKSATRTDGEIKIPLAPLLDLSPALRGRVLRQAIFWISGNLRRLDRRHVASLTGILFSQRPQVSISLPRGLVARKSYDSLIISSGKGKEQTNFLYSLPGPGGYDIPEVGACILLEEMDSAGVINKESSPLAALFDLDRVDYPLTVRNFRTGDRFFPLGMAGRKKLKDLFIDLKIPFELRRKIPLLISSERLMWVCGIRIDERFKVTSGTTRRLRVSWKMSDGSWSPLLNEISIRFAR
jgi:tRNA(Ile)-lysidine synthase